jgi:hypothetical protein
MKKRNVRLIVLRTLKKLGLLCKRPVKSPFIMFRQLHTQMALEKILSEKFIKMMLLMIIRLESAIHVWKELKKPKTIKKRVSIKK